MAAPEEVEAVVDGDDDGVEGGEAGAVKQGLAAVADRQVPTWTPALGRPANLASVSPRKPRRGRRQPRLHVAPRLRSPRAVPSCVKRTVDPEEDRQAAVVGRAGGEDVQVQAILAASRSVVNVARACRRTTRTVQLGLTAWAKKVSGGRGGSGVWDSRAHSRQETTVRQGARTPDGLVFWRQALEMAVVFLTPDQGAGGTGDAQRRAPMGGEAYGMPRKVEIAGLYLDTPPTICP